MSRVTLVELSPRRAADGVVQALRFGHNARTKARFLGADWLPGIVALPDTELDLGFDGAKFGQGATPQVGQLRIAIGRLDAWAGLVWKGAAGTLRSAPWPAEPKDPDDAAFAIDLSFRVESIAIEDGIASLTLIDLGADLRRPLITRKFGSTGNALLDGAGTIDRRGQVVPTGWGRLRSVPGLLVDRVNNIWLFLDRPSASVQGFFDGGASFTTGEARANLAALAATPPAAGEVDYCLDAGGLTLARPWPAPTYPFTADLTAAGNQTAAGIAQAAVAGRSALAFAAGTIAAFDALYPAPCGLYVDDERTIATALDELVVRLGGFWRLTGAGAIVLGRLAPTAPVRTFGRTEVFSIARQSIVMPTRRRAVGYARNNRVHNDGEIATILLVDDIAGLGDLATQDEVDFGTQVTGPGKPEDNADVTANAVPSLSVPSATTINADFTGAVLSGQLPRTLQAIRKRGDTDVSATTTWSVATQGCSATINTSGLVEITACTSSGWVDVISDRDAVELRQRITVNRVLGSPPATGGGGATAASDPSIGNVTSTSYAAEQGGPLTVRAGSAGQVALTAPLSFSTDTTEGAGTFGLRGKWQWRPVGGTWADVAAEVSETFSDEVFDEFGVVYSIGSGFIEVNQTKTGLTSGTDYEFRLLLRLPTGTATRFIFDGVATAVAS
jgi:hypothetical protein